jgi:hypothetical protein
MVLGIELRAYTLSLFTSSFIFVVVGFVKGFLKIGSQTVILLISAT